MFYVAILLVCSSAASSGCYVASQQGLYVSMEACQEAVAIDLQGLQQAGITARGGCSAVTTGEPA